MSVYPTNRTGGSECEDCTHHRQLGGDVFTAKTGRKPLAQKHEALKACADTIALDKAGKKVRELVYMPRVFVSTTLPISDPGAIEYKRRDGDIRLAMTSSDNKLPWGLFPRLILMWLCTQVRLRKQRDISLGKNNIEFLRSVCGLDGSSKPSDHQRKQIREQFNRLLGTLFEIKDTRNGGEVITPFELAEHCDFWEMDDMDKRGIITLTPDFFELAKSSIPFDRSAIRALGGSAFQIDVFLWLTARIARIQRSKGTTHKISYRELHQQFGTRQKHTCDFKRELLRALETIALAWPRFRYSYTKEAIEFHWTDTIVPRLTETEDENEYELGDGDRGIAFQD